MSSRAKAILVFVLGGALATTLAILALAGAQPPSVDPAFVSLVYARHHAEHGALYWNGPGEPGVAYASFLYVAIEGLLFRISPRDPLRDAQLLTIACVIASAITGAAFAARASRGAFRGAERGERAGELEGARPRVLSNEKEATKWGFGLGLLGAVAFGVNLASVHGAAFLLETPLFVTLALVSLGLVLFGRHDRGVHRLVLGFVWLLLVQVRGEGLPIAVLHAGIFLLLGRSRRWPFLPPAAFAVMAALYAISHPIPDSALAKAPALDRLGEGISYATQFLLDAPPRALAHVLLAVLPLVALAKTAPWVSVEARRRVAIAGASAFVAFASVLFEGGDVWASSRLLAVPIAFAIAAAVLAVFGLSARWRLAPVIVLSLFVLEALTRIAPSPVERVARIAKWPMTNERFACEKAAIDAIATRATSFAETDTARAKFYDDSLVVHDRRGDDAVADAVKTEDEVLQIGVRSMTSKPMASVSTEEIVLDDKVAALIFGRPFTGATKKTLQTRYRPVSIPTCGFYYNVFVRNDVIAPFEGSDILIGPSKQFD